MNLIQDWFPKEARIKQQQNEKEATKEMLTEMGVDPNARCVVM
jgi:Fe2+ transport system protein FeoA